MDLPNGLDSHNVLRRVHARDILTNALPRSRGPFPGKVPVKAGTSAGNDGTALFTSAQLLRQVKVSDSQATKVNGDPEAEMNEAYENTSRMREVEDITIPGEEEFKSICNSIHKTRIQSDFVASFTKTTEKFIEVDNAHREKVAITYGKETDDIGESSINSRRHKASLVSLYAKTENANNKRPGTDSETTAENGPNSGKAVGRRRGTRTTGNRTKRHEERVHTSVGKHYIPSYVQPVSDSNVLRSSQNYVGSSNNLSTFAESVNRRPGGKGFVKRQHAQRGDNRLSSSSSGDSSDNEPAPSRQTPPRVLRRRMRGHRSGAANPTVSRSSSHEDNQTSDTFGQACGRRNKHALLSDDSKYATLPANFRPSFKDVSSTPAKAAEKYQQNILHGSNEPSDVNKKTLLNVHNMISEGKNFPLDINMQHNQPAVLNNATDPHVEYGPRSVGFRTNKGSTHVSEDRHGSSAQVRRASLDKNTVQLPNTTPSVDAIRRVFGTPDLPKTEFGQVYNTVKPKAQKDSNGLSEKSTFFVPANDSQEVLHRPILTKARKVGVDCWPRDEDTIKLLNLGTPDQSLSYGYGSSTAISKANTATTVKSPSTMNAKACKNPEKSCVDLNVSLSVSPKETNLNDPHCKQPGVVKNQDAGIMSKEHNGQHNRNNQKCLECENHEDIDHTEETCKSQWRFEDADAKLNAFNASVAIKSDRQSYNQDIYNEVLQELTASLHDISLDGSPLYTSPGLTSSKSKMLPPDDHDMLHQINGSSVQAIPQHSTSSRKSSVVSQSTALPRKGSMPHSGLMSESTVEPYEDFVEQDTANRNNLKQETPYSEVSFSASSIVSSQEQKRHSQELPQTSVAYSLASVDQHQTDHNLITSDTGHQTAVSKSFVNIADKSLKNSVGDLSCFSESAAIMDNFDTSMINGNKYDSLSKMTYKVCKKKSFSDPITDAVVTAGKKITSEHDNAALNPSSSEPNISEQMNASGELNSRTYKNVGTNLHTAGPPVTTATYERPLAPQEESHESAQLVDPRFPTSHFHVGSAHSDSSNRSSLAERSDTMEHSFEKEEKHFQQVLESMTSEASSRKASIVHARSCSEPFDAGKTENHMLRDSGKRSRRPGTILAPSLDDVSLSFNSKPATLFGSETRSHASTLPRVSGGRSVNYMGDLNRSNDRAKLVSCFVSNIR